MTTIEERPAAPFWLQGNFAPVPDEITATELPVSGRLPAALDGLLLRNGPNPPTGSSPHWFLGNGMLHGLRLRGGTAEWYRNRYVQTPALDPSFDMMATLMETGKPDRIGSLANTHVIGHGGRILALEEGHFPWELSPELDTVGVYDYAGKLNTAMTAHPKLCPETGELLFFGYDFQEPYLTYHRADAAGNLVQSTPISVPGPTMMHDFNATRHHVIFMDLPVVFDLEAAMRGEMPYRWSDTYGARLGVMPRDGTDADCRWYEVDPCYVFHPMNAWEVDGRITLDVCRFPDMWRQAGDFSRQAPPTLHRWLIDTASGTVKEEPLDDVACDFPRVADDKVGLHARYGYATATAEAQVGIDFGGRLLKYDLDAGTSVVHEFGPGRHPSEGVFVGDPDGSAEDDGWVLAWVYDEATDRSEVSVLDSRDFAGDPVATVDLPRRVPYGFHGSWIGTTA